MANEKKFTLRIPDDLHEQLKSIADQDMRSLHSQILVMLREGVERRPAPRKLTDSERRREETDRLAQEGMRRGMERRERKLPILDDEDESQS